MKIKLLIFITLLMVSLKGRSQYSGIKVNYYGGANENIDGTNDAVSVDIPNGTTLLTLNVNIYEPVSYSSGQNIQEISNLVIYSNCGNYDIFDDYDASGNPYTVFTLNQQQTSSFIIQQSYSAYTEAVLNSGFSSSQSFPVSSQSFPADIWSEYAQATPNIQSNNSSIISKAQSLTSNCATMQDAVEKIAEWVVGAIDYVSSEDNSNEDAYQVFQRGYGNCVGFSNLMIALLRSVGIPGRFIGGVILNNEYQMPFPYGTVKTGKGGDAHAMYEVYYPDKGWVAADAQGTLNYVTTNFVRFTQSPDASSTVLKVYNGTIKAGGSQPVITIGNMCGNVTSFYNLYTYDSYSFFNAAKQQKSLTSVAAGLSTGIYDKVEITSGTSQFKTGEDVSYSAHFSSGDGSTYPISWYWEIRLYYSGGSYVLTSESNDLSTWSTRTSPLIPSYDWLIDSNGRIFGEVIVTVGTNDGDFTSAKFPVGVDECSEILLENQSYTSNTTEQSCYVTLNNVNVQNNAKLTIDYEMGVTIEKDFNVLAGSQLDIY